MDRSSVIGQDLRVVQERLRSASFVFEDPAASVAGVEDALDACRHLREATEGRPAGNALSGHGGRPRRVSA